MAKPDLTVDFDSRLDAFLLRNKVLPWRVPFLAANGGVRVFRGKGNQSTHRYRLMGLNRAGRYQLTFQDHPDANRAVSGESLVRGGVDVSLRLPLSSELIFLEELH